MTGAPFGPGSCPSGRASKAVSPVPAAIPGAFNVVTDHHFTMTEEDIEGRYHTGYFINDTHFRGRRIGSHPDAKFEEVPLNVPLCKGCDGVIDQGICKACEFVHADLVPLTSVEGDPFLRRVK